MDKKGIVYASLTTLILIILSAVVLIIVIGVFYRPFVVDTVNDYTCFMSVVIKSYSKGAGTGVLQDIPVVGSAAEFFNSPFDLKCKMKNVKVKTKEEAKKRIAKEMASCWGNFGEGKYDFYSDIQFGLWSENNNLCYTCARISSDLDIKITGSEMAVYLRDKKPRPLLDQRTYLQYITGTGSKEGGFLSGVDNLEISDSKNLFVLFLVNKKESALNRAIRAGTTTAATVGVLTFAGLTNPIAGRLLANPIGIATGATLSVLAGAGSGLFQSKGFNAIVMATDSKGVKELCKGGFAQ